MKINGQEVLDAKKELVVRILSGDVRAGKIKDPHHCAAAESLMRSVPNCTSARVHLARTYLKIGKQWFRFETPHSLRSEVVAFDRGGMFRPGEYILKPISNYEMKKRGKAHGKAPAKKADRKPSPKKRHPYHVVKDVRPSAHHDM